MKQISSARIQASRRGLNLVVLLLLLLNMAGLINLSLIQRLENYTYDLRLQWTMPGSIDRRIVIVDIDEASLHQQGRWPWPRNKVAHLVDLLFDRYKIDVLGFDVLFAERDESSGLASLEALGQTDLRDDKKFATALARLRPRLRYDQTFADCLKDRRVALGYYFRHDFQDKSQVGQLPAPALARGSFDVNAVAAAVASGYAANLPEFQQSAAGGGFFNVSPMVDQDGVFRRISLLQMYDAALYETLSLAVVRLALRAPPLELVYEGGDTSSVALDSLKLGQQRIPVDADLAALVPFRGKQGSFVYVSASAVLQETVDPDMFRGAIVLVGTTAPGLLDLHNTPMQESYAGVEVHANMIAAMLDGSIKQRPAYTLGLEIILLCIVGLPLSWVLPALSPMRATVLVVATQIVMVTTNLYFWNFSNLIVPLASGLVLTVVLFVFNMSYGFFVDSRAKRLLARIFGQYVPQELVDEMAKDPGAYSLAGSNREMTVLFSDVRGFTSISEGLEPEQLTQLMNAYLTPMTEVIQHHRGTIDKYIGDAIMAFWGAPVADQQHARRALQAALDMVASLPRLEDHFKQRGWPPIRIGVGLSTGTMTVGNMGSNFRLAYTVMGDAVNLGSRLEGLTKEYGVQIIVNELTRLAVPEFAFRELDRVCVKGKIKPVKIYEPIGLLSQLSNAEQLELSAYDDALALYQAQYWPEAATAFRLLQRSIPHRVLYQVYLRRIAYFLDHPPAPDWDGSFTFTTK